ncbi:hypothetical protein EL26_05475 [Tumebacillus flagellatus]|uniref:Fe/B12 periplasmic-binding domain-containing protein n=1 Tax=Tumebacillus flagellatus TaxID=1157490 RepID=A0A074MEJ6_9BACL|nr:hypothetical protein EL26_05475 [Tumebacillus flagellatus]
MWMAGLLLMTTMMSGCGSQQKDSLTKPADPVSAAAPQEKIIHNMWGDVTIQGTPKKIVALDFSLTDALISLGIQPAGVAGTGQTQVPEYIQDKVQGYSYVGDRNEPNLDMIRHIKPDLIIADPDRSQNVKAQLQTIAPTLALNDTSYQEMLDNVTVLGDVLDCKERAEKVKLDLLSKINNTKAKIQDKPSVLVIGGFGEELTVWISNSFVGSLMKDLGLSYDMAAQKVDNLGGNDVSVLSLQQLADLDPDYIFFYGETLGYRDDPLFQNLSAVKNRHFLEVDRNLWSRGRGPIAASKIIDDALPLLTAQVSH